MWVGVILLSAEPRGKRASWGGEGCTVVAVAVVSGGGPC